MIHTREKDGLTITVVGKPAVAILALIAVFFLWRLAVTRDSVPPEVEAHVRQELVAEYSRALLPELQKGVEEKDDGRLGKTVAQITSLEDRISFVSLKSRGGRSRMVVRAEIQVDGHAPPVGKPVRYYRFHYSPLLGYVYQMETFALEYYVPL